MVQQSRTANRYLIYLLGSEPCLTNDARGATAMTVHDPAEPFAGLDALARLERLLDLEDIGENLFRGHTPPTDQIRVFGGQVAGQALVAVSRTVEQTRHVHSLHAYFLRPGDPKAPIL
ncbi:MAG: acyl-CoA thioesterase, partial [Frankiales bacterium]|nr:acyl-CoA thioesterase [Frankiales bacterium]